MKMIRFGFVLTAVAFFTACNDSSSTTAQDKSGSDSATIIEQAIDIKADTATLKSVVAYSSDTIHKKPIVLIVPEWWGLTDYVKTRAKQLAELGYLAIGVDMYGDGKIAADPAAAQAYATPFYANPAMAEKRLEAALAVAKQYSFADTANTAAIGYCFGGSMVLNGAKLGLAVKGVVSFHGGLAGGVVPQKGKTTAQVLLCHGEDDKFVSKQDVETFKKQMDSVGAPFTFKSYPGATHAFTNPEATEIGKKFNLPIAYNAVADSASWQDMRTFFGAIFNGK